MTKTIRQFEQSQDEMLAKLRALPLDTDNPRAARLFIGVTFDCARAAMGMLVLEWTAKDLVSARLAQGMLREIASAFDEAKEKAGCRPDDAEPSPVPAT